METGTGTTEKFSISLPRPMYERIERELEYGQHSTVSEVIRAAVRVYLDAAEEGRRRAAVGVPKPTAGYGRVAQ